VVQKGRGRTLGYLIFDRGTNFNEEVIDTVKSFGIQPKRTSFRSPWQNGVAECWVATCRRDLLDHVIAVNERHLRRLMNEYIRYYLEDRTHLALAKETPTGREAKKASRAGSRIITIPRLGGLHHYYDLAALSCCKNHSPKLKRIEGEVCPPSPLFALRRAFIALCGHKTNRSQRKATAKIDHQIRDSNSFFVQMEFWRGTCFRFLLTGIFDHM
jgi:Integrase core domain